MASSANDVETRLDPWLLALVLPIIGFVCGVYVGAAIRLGGAPGAALMRHLDRHDGTPPPYAWEVALICLGQLVVSLLWVVVLYLSVAHLLQGRVGLGVYAAWALALGAAAVPAQSTLSMFTLTERERDATLITLRVTTVVAVVLLFVPGRLESALGWLPSLPPAGPG